MASPTNTFFAPNKWIFLVVMVGVFFSQTHGFTIQRPSSNQGIATSKSVPRRFSVLGMVEGDENEDTLESLGFDKSPEKPPVKKDSMKKMVFDLTFNTWSVVIYFFGIFFSVGLLLNIFGYGYQFTDDGFRVDTLQQLRAERQFRQEIIESIKETSTPQQDQL